MSLTIRETWASSLRLENFGLTQTSLFLSLSLSVFLPMVANQTSYMKGWTILCERRDKLDGPIVYSVNCLEIPCQNPPFIFNQVLYSCYSLNVELKL